MLLVGCAPPSDRGDRNEIHVFAAASLTEAMTAIAADFEMANPGSTVVLTFAGSQVLRLQIEQGAHGDVFASADPTHVDALAEQGLMHDIIDFARNDLALIVPEGTDSSIVDFHDLEDVDRLIVGSAMVPVGRYTAMLLDSAAARYGPAFADRVRGRVVSEENNVRLVRAKVALGEADAGIAYRSDAVGADGIRLIDLPEGVGVRATYRIGRVEGARNPELATRFVHFVRSAEGQARLRHFAFLGADE